LKHGVGTYTWARGLRFKGKWQVRRGRGVEEAWKRRVRVEAWRRFLYLGAWFAF
jgi:hypothetical protein